MRLRRRAQRLWQVGGREDVTRERGQLLRATSAQRRLALQITRLRVGQHTEPAIADRQPADLEPGGLLALGRRLDPRGVARWRVARGCAEILTVDPPLGRVGKREL